MVRLCNSLGEGTLKKITQKSGRVITFYNGMVYSSDTSAFLKSIWVCARGCNLASLF